MNQHVRKMVPGVVLVLGGTEYTVPPLTLGSLEKLQEKLKDFRNGSLDTKSIGTVIDATHAALSRNYPEITRQETADMIDLSDMVDVMAAVMDVAGIKRKEQEAGKARASQT